MTTKRPPPNCGTGYCSCIECVMKPARPAPVHKDANSTQETAETRMDTGFAGGAQPAPVQPVALRDALADSLGSVYVCDRVWSAWGVGTMTQDDFYPAAESDEVLDSLVEAIAKATPPAAQRQWVGLTKKQKAEIAEDWAVDVLPDIDHVVACIEAKLKEKNT
jgi:hypothetical protein